MRIRLLKYLFVIPLVVFHFSCNKKDHAGLSEGRIDFDISYSQDKIGNHSTNMMPQRMRMEYKDHFSKNTIEGGLGFFSLVNIADNRNFRNTTCLRFIDKKYVFKGEKKEPPCCFGKLEGMQLEFTGKTREIAGLSCKHALASFPDDDIESFDIWYTEEIPLNHPNGNSPFSDIPGVMLEFNTIMGNITMHVRATKYESVRIQDSEFKSPDNYRSVTRVEMEKIIHALLD